MESRKKSPPSSQTSPVPVPPIFEEIDTLSLLAHKITSNVFDLSSGQINVSIRDQMVRAQHLVEDLRAADKEANSILVVGMGVAGMTAALRASELGFKVCAVENRKRPFAMFDGITSRFVGPYMYEWPSSFYAYQSYPSHYSTPWAEHGRAALTWEASKPVTADEFARLLNRNLEKWWSTKAASEIHLFTQVSTSSVQKFVKKFVNTEKKRSQQRQNGEPINAQESISKFNVKPFGASGICWTPHGTAAVKRPTYFTPNYIILAAGMGKENLDIPNGPKQASSSFWENDDLKESDKTNQRIVVLGGGDGAIQDALRALTIHDHPLSLIDQLEASPAVRAALEHEMPALLDADRQLRQYVSWSRSTGGYKMIDNACKSAAKNLSNSAAVLQQVQKSLRKGEGEVILCVKEDYFGKSYLLNRFVAHLLAACVNIITTKEICYMRFSVHFNTEVIAGYHNISEKKYRLDIITHPTAKWSISNIDSVVVRFGIKHKTIPRLQLIQLSEETGNPQQRTTLKRVELPFVAM